MGTFLVSASYSNGEMASITVTSEKGGRMRLGNPELKPGEQKEVILGTVPYFV